MVDDAPRLRADARENRDRIVGAARSLFAERGLDVGVKEVAWRARVAPATLHRRFPTRDALIAEAFAAEMHACRGVVVQGARDPEAWRGLSRAVRGLIALSAGNRRFVDAVERSGDLPAALGAHRRELLGLLEGLVRRARAGGEVRSDVQVEDLVLLLQAGRGLPPQRRSAGPSALDRFADLALAGLRAGR